MIQLLQKITPQFAKTWAKEYLRQSRMKKYAGSQVQCPICMSTFREFAPYGLLNRKNARCPSCDSLERHRLMWKYLHEKTDFFDATKRLNVLHFAPEKIFYDAFANDARIEYHPCDLYPEIYNFDHKVKVEKVDITAIPHADATFDVILCNHVLEHIPDDHLAMTELLRVMKTGAWAILQVPIDYNREHTYEDFTITSEADREKAFGQKDHVRWYGRDYPTRLTKAGFEVVEDPYVKTFSDEELFRNGLMRSELVYYCKKK